MIKKKGGEKMTVKEMKELLKELPDEATLLFVSSAEFKSAAHRSQVDDIYPGIVPANDKGTSFYLYSEEEFYELENEDEAGKNLY